MFSRKNQEKSVAIVDSPDAAINEDPLAAIPKTQLQKVFPVLAAGSGLFAEGYIQSVRLRSPSYTAPVSHSIGHWICRNHARLNLWKGILEVAPAE